MSPTPLPPAPHSSPCVSLARLESGTSPQSALSAFFYTSSQTILAQQSPAESMAQAQLQQAQTQSRQGNINPPAYAGPPNRSTSLTANVSIARFFGDDIDDAPSDAGLTIVSQGRHATRQHCGLEVV
jgi:hypothetical protein